MLPGCVHGVNCLQLVLFWCGSVVVSHKQLSWRQLNWIGLSCPWELLAMVLFASLAGLSVMQRETRNTTKHPCLDIIAPEGKNVAKQWRHSRVQPKLGLPPDEGWVCKGYDKPRFCRAAWCSSHSNSDQLQIIQISKAGTWAARSEGGKKGKGGAEKTEKGMKAGLTASEEQSYFG